MPHDPIFDALDNAVSTYEGRYGINSISPFNEEKSQSNILSFEREPEEDLIDVDFEEIDEQSQTREEKIADLNDKFRCASFDENDFSTYHIVEGIFGFRFCSTAVDTLGDENKSEIIKRVSQYDDFGADNPLRDMGVFEFKNEKILFRIEYFSDENMEHISDCPEDPEKCFRVLAIALANEAE